MQITNVCLPHIASSHCVSATVLFTHFDLVLKLRVGYLLDKVHDSWIFFRYLKDEDAFHYINSAHGIRLLQFDSSDRDVVAVGTNY